MVRGHLFPLMSLVQKEMAPKTHVYFQQTLKKINKKSLLFRLPGVEMGRVRAQARKACQEKFGARGLCRLWEMLWERLCSLGNGAGDFEHAVAPLSSATGQQEPTGTRGFGRRGWEGAGGGHRWLLRDEDNSRTKHVWGLQQERGAGLRAA